MTTVLRKNTNVTKWIFYWQRCNYLPNPEYINNKEIRHLKKCLTPLSIELDASLDWDGSNLPNGCEVGILLYYHLSGLARLKIGQRNTILLGIV